MKLLSLITGLLSIFAISQSIGAPFELQGRDSAYSETYFIVERYKDHITEDTEIIDTVDISQDGSFYLKAEINHTTFIFFDLGRYFVYFYVEPGKKYEIVLPPRDDKSKADELNPYFNPTYIHLAQKTKNPDGLNYLIQSFDILYEPYFSQFAVRKALNKDYSGLNKAIEELSQPFSDVQNIYFKNYAKYKIGMLRHLALQHKSRAISDDYFNGHPVLYHHPAYMELFDKVYDKYFMFLSRTKEGSAIYENINKQKSYDSLKLTMQKDSTFNNDTLLDLVIIKNLHDEFYRANFSRKALLAVLDSLIKKSNAPVEVEIAKNVRFKTTKLLKGFKPPAFSLYDKEGELHSLDDFKGHYVYLNFCTCHSYSCMNEYEYLQEIYERHHEHLKIITVVTDEKPSILNEFFNVYDYNWLFLHYGNQMEIIDQYDVRAYPTYYLIGPSGKLQMSPAPSPAEGFESQLFKLMRSKGDI